MPVNAHHPLLSTICPALSLLGLVLGVVMMPLVAFGVKWARSVGGLGGCLLFLPLATGIALMYGKHWEFRALAPYPALSADGTTYRDGCELGPDELHNIRGGGYPERFYLGYAVLIAIPVLSTLDDRIKQRAAAKQAARYAATRRRR